MTPLEDLLQQCTVKITVLGGWGTGFFVAPGLILTCAHVVRKAADLQVTVSSPVWQQPLSAIVKAKADDGKTLDLALIELSEPLPDHPCVLLDEEPVAIGQALYSYGYLESYTNAAPVRPVNEGLTGDTPPLLKLQGAQIEKGISGAALLNLKTGKVCGVVKETRAAGFDLGGGAIPTRVILEQFPELRSLQQAFHGGDRRWVNLITQPGIDFQPYLRSLIANEKYQQKWGFYTPTDAVGKIQQLRSRSGLDIGLMVQLTQPKMAEGDGTPEQEKKTERLPVLEGIRKYAADHVLLMGRPGSGKSTALLSLLVEAAQQALADPSARIPVLVELRYLDADRPSVLERIGAFLQSHALSVEEATLKAILAEGKLLLLIDGVNELPSESARRAVARFRQDYAKTPMIFTTRDIAIGGDVGIEKKLEMQSLNESQMRQFVQAYLPEQGEPMLRQLQGRLREVGQTPLLLWMLCQVFQGLQQIPASLGLLFRWFTREYDKLKRDVPVSEGLRHWQAELLQYLAFRMVQGKPNPEVPSPSSPPPALVAIYCSEAEAIITEFLQGKVDYPLKRAKEWLEDLQEHYLLQRKGQDQLEFHHQLIQEYYAAEYLLQLLQPSAGKPGLTDDQLKQDYLNYLKWTEPIALMLALVDDEAQALRVVKLAMDEVDLMLGARLAGEVQPAFHIKTISRINGLEIPLLLKLKCWEASRSETMIPELLKFLEAPNSSLRIRTAKILEQYKCESATSGLLKALKHQSASVRSDAARVLGIIGNEKSISGLLDIIKDPDADVQTVVIRSLGRIGNSTITPYLIDALEDANDAKVRDAAAAALGEIGGETVISRLMLTLQNPNTDIRSSAIDALAKIGGDTAINALENMALKESNYYIQWKIGIELGELGIESIAPFLVGFLNNQNTCILENTVRVLGEIGNETMIKELLKAFENKEYSVRRVTAQALSKIGGEAAISALIFTLEHPDSHVRDVVIDALEEIGNEAAVFGLLKALEDKELSIRWQAIDKLEVICNKELCSRLLSDFNHQDFYVAWKVASILERDIDESIMLESVIPGLLNAIERYDSHTRKRAAQALGQIGGEAVISELIKSLEHQNDYTRKVACEALGKIGNEVAIHGLLKLLSDENYYVRLEAISALKKIGCGCEEVASKLLYIVEAEGANSLLYARAAEALGQVGSPSMLPDLHRILHNQPLGSYPPCTSTISAIQKRCQFYNYKIFQAHLAVQKADRPQSQNNDPNAITIQTLESLTIMTDKAPIFNQQHATIGVNYAAEGSKVEFNQHTSASEQTFEILLSDYQQFIQQLQQKYPTLADATTIPQIIEVEAKLIETQDRQRWQNFLNLKRLWNGSKEAGFKIGEHFAENNVWTIGAIAFLEGVSEDEN